MDETQRLLIVGAGPCGLACARELDRLGHRNWRLLEAAGEVGGLARSIRDPAGFTWDLGGHVVFSHYRAFDALLEEVMGEDVLRHERSSYVRSGDVWVPYPFQNNLRHLPEPVLRECLDGLANAPGGDLDGDFASWLTATFGPGITRHFQAPYNTKVWATEPARMQSRWIGERVAVIDYARAAAAVRAGEDDLGWGPNHTFTFPRQGGTGEIYRRMAAPLADRILLNAEVVGIDPSARALGLGDGARLSYDALVSTAPLNRLVASIAGVPPEIADAAAGLVHNTVYMVGVGYRRPLWDDRSWLYFPDPDVPFYRVTNFAKYAAANVPGGATDRYSSYMTETASSTARPVSRRGLEERVLAGLVRVGLAEPDTAVASVHVEEIPYAYPVPTLGRDAALNRIQPWLEAQGILSRGRFGTWRYEIGNMDHAVQMGIEAARRLIRGEPETVLSGPAPLPQPG
ncbi:NAD(P)/FAD-dependent oxidoreductase [Conexibacter sp. DBS9H8]|uniref:protoporphyrinogen/coproporphyrinogen oxidase n=1 Tax=Conexibacter sp. DBS9H8 TaxID=2937801 RepID=UPI00200E3A25|nr:FAD-dependent oxidoreductase [Conexibacter sp. DBS9H8]